MLEPTYNYVHLHTYTCINLHVPTGELYMLEPGTESLLHTTGTSQDDEDACQCGHTHVTIYALDNARTRDHTYTIHTGESHYNSGQSIGNHRAENLAAKDAALRSGVPFFSSSPENHWSGDSKPPPWRRPSPPPSPPVMYTTNTPEIKCTGFKGVMETSTTTSTTTTTTNRVIADVRHEDEPIKMGAIRLDDNMEPIGKEKSIWKRFSRKEKSVRKRAKGAKAFLRAPLPPYNTVYGRSTHIELRVVLVRVQSLIVQRSGMVGFFVRTGEQQVALPEMMKLMSVEQSMTLNRRSLVAQQAVGGMRTEIESGGERASVVAPHLAFVPAIRLIRVKNARLPHVGKVSGAGERGVEYMISSTGGETVKPEQALDAWMVHCMLAQVISSC